MPVLRSGVDLVEIERVESMLRRHGERFLKRVYTDQELRDVKENPASLAARFAAKEAVSKALGTGIGVIAWKEIEVVRGAERMPELRLHGGAARRAEELGLHTWSISLSHTGGLAIAMVVAQGSEQ